jgi:hypothetical protein
MSSRLSNIFDWRQRDLASVLNEAALMKLWAIARFFANINNKQTGYAAHEIAFLRPVSFKARRDGLRGFEGNLPCDFFRR